MVGGVSSIFFLRILLSQIFAQYAFAQKSDFIEIKHKNNVSCQSVLFNIARIHRPPHIHEIAAVVVAKLHTNGSIFCLYVMNINAFIHIYIYICMHGKKKTENPIKHIPKVLYCAFFISLSMLLYALHRKFSTAYNGTMKCSV